MIRDITQLTIALVMMMVVCCVILPSRMQLVNLDSDSDHQNCTVED